MPKLVSPSILLSAVGEVAFAMYGRAQYFHFISCKSVLGLTHQEYRTSCLSPREDEWNSFKPVPIQSTGIVNMANARYTLQYFP